MAINNNQPNTLTGLDAFMASQPRADTPQGGAEFGFRGDSDSAALNPGPNPQGDQPSPFAGMGPLFEATPQEVYKTLNDLVLRQEIIARNHLEQDKHWTLVKLGYPWSTLEYQQDQSQYKQSLPYGTRSISIQAVPNKAWDLVNKATETLLVDFPNPDPSPLNDSEEAEAAADMASRFLQQDASEDGTNDVSVFYEAVDGSLVCGSKYVHVWTDPTGDGSVPLQIKAHPQALSPDQPLVGPDGMPTTDYVLRYVTAQNQFTNTPTEAAPQWQPKLRADVLGREHIRVFPETDTVTRAEKVILLYYCTVGEAKRRWENVRAMSDTQLSALCDWTPTRYLVLLPMFERARWKLTSSDKERSGASDERIMFYYMLYQRSVPDYPRGAQIVVNGANGGTLLDQRLLSADVKILTPAGEQPDTRVLDIPVVQITPRQDPDHRDPSGRAFMEMIGGSVEFTSALQMSYMEALDITLHVEKYIPATSPVEGFQIAEARASGDAIPILQRDDMPQYGNTPVIPNSVLDVLQYTTNQQDSIAGLNAPVQGANDQQEVSGKARQIAVQQAMVGLNRMQKAVNSAYERYCRIKIQLCMRDFTVPQQIRYVGDDGAYMQEQWTGTDFAMVGDVRIKAGSGTMMTPESKVNYLGGLLNFQLINPDDASDAARPTFAKDLGIQENPHDQYIERCVTAWLKGPPEGWAELYGAYQQEMQQYQQAVQPAIDEAQMQGQQAELNGEAPAPPPQLPPEPQQPWNPFVPRPNDQEPEVADRWRKRLSKVISSVKYDQMDPMWRAPLDQKYLTCMQVVAQAQAAAQPQPGQDPNGKPNQSKQEQPNNGQ